MDTATLDPITFDINHIITEDDEPVDNFFSAKQQRLLVRSLYSDWNPGVSFLADANVGIFPNPREYPVVPDMFLSMNVQIAENWHAKENRTYFVWEFGKQPEFVLEVVSNKKGNEIEKRTKYARMGIWYYAIYDPQLHIQEQPLQVYELWGTGYRLKSDTFLDRLELGIALWEGEFEQTAQTWLRWVDEQGTLLLTGIERADVEAERADVEAERADAEAERADAAAQQLQALLAKLEQHGIDPDTLG